MHSPLRAFVRLLLFPSLTFLFVVVTLLMRLIRLPHRYVYTVFRMWRRTMRFVLQIKVIVEGQPPANSAVIMANHRSYLDVVMLHSRTPMVFVAKHSVRRWPIIGWGGDAMKTIWVNRDSADSRKQTRAKIRKRLNQGLSVTVFPEGTTAIGPEVLEFKPGIFHAVAGNDIPIVPVAIEYKNQNMAWVGQDKFIPHFLREFGARHTLVKVCYGTPRSGDNGEVLRNEIHGWISAQCLRYRGEWERV
jgi:1-acyl-sn-glycerol-3-phosphate acyltransferase